MPPHSPAAGPVAHPTVLVVDFGAQYAQLIARRVREAQVYSEIVPHSVTAAELAERSPAAIIFSGGPASVHVEGAPGIDLGVYELGVPILGICYGSQLLARDLGGTVDRSGRGEYGRTALSRTETASELLDRSPGGASTAEPVWMSHFDAVTSPPEGFVVTAVTPDSPAAVIEDVERGFFGVQYHPEVAHTPSGQTQLQRFLHDICQPSARLGVRSRRRESWRGVPCGQEWAPSGGVGASGAP